MKCQIRTIHPAHLLIIVPPSTIPPSYFAREQTVLSLFSSYVIALVLARVCVPFAPFSRAKAKSRRLFLALKRCKRAFASLNALHARLYTRLAQRRALKIAHSQIAHSGVHTRLGCRAKNNLPARADLSARNNNGLLIMTRRFFPAARTT